MRFELQLFGKNILIFRILEDVVDYLRSERAGTVAEATDHLVTSYEQDVNGKEYTLIDWQITVVPMLGFVGTVWGMINAMGNAADEAKEAFARRAGGRRAQRGEKWGDDSSSGTWGGESSGDWKRR